MARYPLGDINLETLIERNETVPDKGPVRLVLHSDVSEMNDNDVGIFNDPLTALFCARLLMELDKRCEPEYGRYSIIPA